MNHSLIRFWTSAALLGAAFACGPKLGPVIDSDGEVLDQAKSGVVKMDNLPNGTGLSRRITAFFVDAPNAKCTIRESGPCRFIDCPSGRTTFSSAGNLSVSDAAANVSIPLVFGTASRGYEGSGAVNSGTLFNAGDDVSAKATGGTVPAFNSSVKGPSPISVTAPVEGTLQVDRMKELTVTWAGQSEGKFVFQLQAQPTNYPVLECRFDGKTASGTIPAAALSLLAAGQFQADAFTRTREITSNEDWNIAVDARYYAGTTGNAYERPAILK